MPNDITTITFNANELKAQSPTINTGVANKQYIDNKLGELSGALIFKGTLDASGSASQLANAKVGWLWVVSVAGTLLSQELKVGDEVYCKTAVTGTPTDFSSFEIIPGEQGVLRTTDVVNNLTSTVTDKPLSANMGKNLQDNKIQVGSNTAIFMVWAEENANFSTGVNGGFQWSFGNGQETPQDNGVIIPVNCELIAVSLSASNATSTGSGTIATYRSGVDLGATLDVTVNSGNGYKSVNNLLNPVTFNAGQYINFRTFNVTGTVNKGIISATFRAAV